jgi:DNA-binding transcriptional LysR family regulator
MSPLRHATFKQLAALHAVARLGSVSAAARGLHLRQPAVSIQIGARGGAAGAPLLVAFANAHPRVKVKLQVGNRDQIVRMLAGQEVDLAIMGRPPAELKTVSAAFARHPMAFLAAPGHALMQRSDLRLAQLLDAGLLVRERGSGTRATVETLFKDAGLPLRIGSEMSSNEAIKQLTAAGLGVAFLSLHTCTLEMRAGLLGLLPLPGNPIERDWFVMHLASRQLPQVAAAFERFLCEQGQALVKAQLEPREHAREEPGPL